MTLKKNSPPIAPHEIHPFLAASLQKPITIVDPVSSTSYLNLLSFDSRTTYLAPDLPVPGPHLPEARSKTIPAIISVTQTKGWALAAKDKREHPRASAERNWPLLDESIILFMLLGTAWRKKSGDDPASQPVKKIDSRPKCRQAQPLLESAF